MRKKGRHLVLISALFCCICASGQENWENYVLTERLTGNGGRKIKTVRIFDGLGRPTTIISDGIAGDGSSVYQYNIYNETGQVSISYLPVCIGTSFSSVMEDEIQKLSHAQYNDSRNFTFIEYDALNRIVRTLGPGTAWGDNGKDRTVSYGTNKENSVKKYEAPCGEKYSLVKNGYYKVGTLYSKTFVDEDGHTTEVFTDKLGKTVLIRRDANNDTYYVYNALGQLRFILSPEYQNSGYKDKFAYEYRYDGCGRVSKKIIPGCEYVQYWYDKGDRVAFMQDALLREKGKYRFFLYDKIGRLVIQGVCGKDTKDKAKDNILSVRYDMSIGGICSTGYCAEDNSVYASADIEVATFYDDYGFLENDVVGNLLTIPVDIDRKVCLQGLATGMLVGTSDGGKLLKVFCYDPVGRVARVVETYPQNVTMQTDLEYSFTDNVTRKKETLVKDGKTYTVTTDYTYNGFNDKIAGETVTINGKSNAVSKFAYSNIGRVETCRQNNNACATEYTYNNRGWIKTINNKFFSERIFYNDGVGKPCYNGNVSSIKWQTPDYGQVRGYEFYYDGLDRLAEAIYGEREDLSNRKNRYDEKVVAYTANGMIKRFQRRGLKDNGEYGKIDNLNIVLDGNQIQKVTDDAQPVRKYGTLEFRDRANENVECTYNGNGALTRDLNRDITEIRYDNLCNPVQVMFQDSLDIVYSYDALGNKLKTGYGLGNFTIAPISPVERTYIEEERYGNFIFSSSEYQYCFDGGYIMVKDGNPVFYFFVKDHIGSNRVVFDENGKIVQLMHYYPFGGHFADADIAAEAQKSKFAGKELERMQGLDTYDFGARQYYPCLPSWDRIDSKCEDHPEISPYVFCKANPVKYTDPDGKDYKITIEQNQITVSAKISAMEEDYDVAHEAAVFINSQSGRFAWKFKDGNETKLLPINFNITVNKVSDGQRGKRHSLQAATLNGEDYEKNTFMLVDNLPGAEQNGQTGYGRFIKVKNGADIKQTVAHEFLHALGVFHSMFGIMTPGREDLGRNLDVVEQNINDMIYGALYDSDKNDKTKGYHPSNASANDVKHVGRGTFLDVVNIGKTVLINGKTKKIR